MTQNSLTADNRALNDNRRTLENTFTYNPIERDGQTFHIATANEYPWINVQIIPFPEEEHDESIAKIKAQKTIGWVVEHPGRRDFVVIHAGGNKVPLHITQENYKQVADDMQECMRNAAKWWAEWFIEGILTD